jgi:hypothetical protein
MPPPARIMQADLVLDLVDPLGTVPRGVMDSGEDIVGSAPGKVTTAGSRPLREHKSRLARTNDMSDESALPHNANG